MHNQFIKQFNHLQHLVHQDNINNGWWNDRHSMMAHPDWEPTVVIACLGLVTSEVAEAMEAVRKHPRNTWRDHTAKDTLVRELAGTIIRCMDLAGALDLPLAEAIVTEMTANRARGERHGGKKA